MKSSKYKYRLIMGYREAQFYTVDAEEVHKAYYLFLNPEARAVFSNGVAIVGKNIMGIEPDYNATMGWTPTHRLDDDDYLELENKGILNKMRNIQTSAKELAYMPEVNNFLNEPFSEVAVRLELGEKKLKQITN